ncbi:ABC transporter permease [Mesorhizobium sp. 1B3]|uniref:ABC transporter permease n=1 Tax=Mesorhizobium sp. 1B3 TaxID=3243599 RepID=UPI003D979EBE
MLIFLVSPIVIVSILSFSSADTLMFPPPGFSLRWYERFWSMTSWWDALWISLKVALLCTLFSTGLALPAAFALVRGRFPGKRYIYALIFSPMIVPTIISAVALYFFFGRIGANGSILAMALGHTVLALPIAVMVICASLQGVDRRYEMAAYSLGAGPVRTFVRITFPLIWPATVTAALFSFLTSFDELLIPMFLSGISTETLSVMVWNSLLLEVDPMIAAVSTLFVISTATILLIVAVLRR